MAELRAGMIPVFDGHNDMLHRLWEYHRDQAETVFLQGSPVPSALENGTDCDARAQQESIGHLDWPRMQAGHFAGGLFALWIPTAAFSEERQISADWRAEPVYSQFELPSLQQARDYIFDAFSLLTGLVRAFPDRLAVCRSVCEIRQAMQAGRVAVVIHMEGAEAIDPDLHLLDVLYAAGLRSLGPVWSRPNRFGAGVPFRFPSSPDTGSGLTAEGIRLIRACHSRHILVDVSHMDARGFWQTAELGGAPLVASHSNAHALCAQSRNLTDDQLAAIRQTGGFVGVNFGTSFLRADGCNDPSADESEIVRHVEYLLEKLGEDGVGFGSDFDGTAIPAGVGDAAGLPKILQALARRGYSQVLLDKIAHGNWLRVLEQTWGE